MASNPIPISVTSTPPRNLQRPLPPSLSLGPPSQNASNVSLPSLYQINTHTSTTSNATGSVLLRSRSNRAPESIQTNPMPLGRSAQQKRQQQEHRCEGDRTDALWAKMQATLAEVELSAARGTHFFGPEHYAALEELRTSQIALAQAWARSEADETLENPGERENGGLKDTGADGGRAGSETGKGLEDSTEEDILLARKRREANDEYFYRVQSGVLDVVSKLDEVALAMGKVERESREIWSGSESVATGSAAT